MKLWYDSIFDKIQDLDLSLDFVGKQIGSTKQELSNFRKKGQLGFRKLVRLAYFLYSENPEKKLTEWCQVLSTTESIRQSFEYASITRNIPLLTVLIDKYSIEKGTLQKYVKVYSILLDFYTNKINAGDIKVRLDEVGIVTDNELKILTKIMKCYYTYFHNKYSYTVELAKEAEVDVSNLSERSRFVSECYLHRIAEIVSLISLHFNDLKTAKHYATIIINADICPKTVSDAYYTLGMSYLVSDEQQALNCLTKRYEITKKLGEVDLKNNARKDLDLARLYLNKQLPDDSEEVLKRIQEKSITRFELKEEKKENYRLGDDELFVVIEAKYEKNLNALYKCRKKFTEGLNFYFASITSTEIKKIDKNPHQAIDELIDMKITTQGDVIYEKDFIRCFNNYSDSIISATA